MRRVYSLSSLQSPDDVPGSRNFYPEAVSGWKEISQIEGYYSVGLSIDRRLKDHLVVRISQLWAPQKMGLHWRNKRCEGIKEDTDFDGAQPRSRQVIRSCQYGLVLDKHADCRDCFDVSAAKLLNKASGSAVPTSQRCNYYVRVQACDHIADDMLFLVICKCRRTPLHTPSEPRHGQSWSPERRCGAISRA